MTAADTWAASRDETIRQAFGLGVDLLRPAGVIAPAALPDVEWNARKIATLAPMFRERFVHFLDLTEQKGAEHGVDFIVWEGVRSIARQLKLYRQGRTTPGKIVTKTIASNHLFGCAIDLCARSLKGQPVFALPPWYTSEVLPLAKVCGLESLYLRAGIDKPHIELARKDRPALIAQFVEELKASFPGP